MRKRRWVFGALAFAVMAAACGDDDDGATDTTALAGAATTAAGAATTALGAADTTAPESAPGVDTTASTNTTTAGPASTQPAAGGDVDAENGVGASEFQAALEATADAPLAADSSLDPFVIAVPNMEGDPAGSFPDVGDGAEAAIQLINDRLGGIGADIEAGAPGRPIELVYCGHVIDQNEAQGCANQIADADPNIVIPGVEFFTPLMYPIFADLPVVQMLPIFVADFDQPGIYAPFGGCVTAFPGSAQMVAEIKGHDRLGLIRSLDPAGVECWGDLHERFLQYYADTLENFEFEGFPYTPGESAGFPAVIQQVSDYLAGAENGAVYLGLAAADCATFIQGLKNAGVDHAIYVADSCNDEAVRGLRESEGVTFESAGYVVQQPEFYNDFIQFELAEREAAIEAYGPEAPVSSFMRQMFSAVTFVYQVANQAIAAGTDIDDREALRSAIGAVDNFHLLGYYPISCANNTSEYESICNRRTTFAQWDGQSFTIDADIPNGFIDVTELLLAVEEAYPRGG